jgi:hypothetical protein
MKRLTTFLLLAGLLLLTACNKQDYVIYSGMEAGTMDAGVFTSDSNKKMNVVGNEGNYDVRTSRRVLISYETHQVTDPDRIDIDLLGLLDAAILLPDPVESLPDEPDGSPIQVTDAWFSMAYLNILISFPGTDASKHSITSSFLTGENGVVVRLHHDASTDTAAGDKAITAFLSVPIGDLRLSYDDYARSQGKKQGDYPMPVILQWSARTLEGGPLSIYERKGSYTPPTSN